MEDPRRVAAAPTLAALAIVWTLPDPPTPDHRAVAPTRTVPSAASRSTRSPQPPTGRQAPPGVPADLAAIDAATAADHLGRAGVTVDGTIEAASTWTDGHGKNLVVMMRDVTAQRDDGAASTVTLRVAYLSGLDARPRVIRRLRDPGLRCPHHQPLAADFTAAAFEVRDRDGDGLPEVRSAGPRAAGTPAPRAGSDWSRCRTPRCTCCATRQSWVPRVPRPTMSPKAERWPAPVLDSALAAFHRLYLWRIDRTL